MHLNAHECWKLQTLYDFHRKLVPCYFGHCMCDATQFVELIKMLNHIQTKSLILHSESEHNAKNPENRRDETIKLHSNDR